MKKNNIPVERDRETTEKRLLDAIGEMIAESGFEKIGINALAAQADVSKILIYRYFGSVDGLMAAYVRQHDFWINFPHAVPTRKELPHFLKSIFREQIAQLRNNPTLKRLYRWELSSNNEMIGKLREQREKIGLKLVETVSETTGLPKEEIASIATILTASITYLVMLEEYCPQYNGIQLSTDEGWEQLNQGIDILIEKWFANADNKKS